MSGKGSEADVDHGSSEERAAEVQQRGMWLLDGDSVVTRVTREMRESWRARRDSIFRACFSIKYLRATAMHN